MARKTDFIVTVDGTESLYTATSTTVINAQKMLDSMVKEVHGKLVPYQWRLEGEPGQENKDSSQGTNRLE